MTSTEQLAMTSTEQLAISTGEPMAIPPVAFEGSRALDRHVSLPLLTPLLGLTAWVLGLLSVHRGGIGRAGLLVAGHAWFVAVLLLLLAGFLLELRRGEPRTWLLCVHLVALITAIHASVPILFGAPEFAWTYKHVGIASAFQRYGYVTDPGNIYQQWPVLFAGLAALGSLAHVNAISFAAWAPLAFELADAMLLLALFRAVGGERRVAWLAVLVFEGMVSWVGQDYLSPQAFGYTLWLALALIILRWLRTPAEQVSTRGRLGRLRSGLVADLPELPAVSPVMRAFGVWLISTIAFAIVAAHQLTPYMALVGVLALWALDLIRPRWLVPLLAVITIGYLVPHYETIAHDFGGLFSGGNPLANASGAKGSTTASLAQRWTARITLLLMGLTWLSTFVLVLRRRRRGARVTIPAVLAFSPFLILGAQSYGGEAIYRVYLFSAPWCALIIAGALLDLRARLRWPATAAIAVAVTFAGVQGLYGPVIAEAFTPAEVHASQWLYRHIPRGSLIVLGADQFPTLETADYNRYQIDDMPADPQFGPAWVDEANPAQVRRWIISLGYPTAYVVLSRSMAAWAAYYGAPRGYAQLARELQGALGGTAVFRNRDVTIYRLSLSALQAQAAASSVVASASPVAASAGGAEP